MKMNGDTDSGSSVKEVYRGSQQKRISRQQLQSGSGSRSGSGAAKSGSGS